MGSDRGAFVVPVFDVLPFAEGVGWGGGFDGGDVVGVG